MIDVLFKLISIAIGFPLSVLLASLFIALFIYMAEWVLSILQGLRRSSDR